MNFNFSFRALDNYNKCQLQGETKKKKGANRIPMNGAQPVAGGRKSQALPQEGTLAELHSDPARN